MNLVGGQNGISASNIPVTDDHRWYIGVYFQDDWKVNPKLTLNLGLRWDLFTPYTETRGFQSNFLPVSGNGPTATFYIPNQGCQTVRSPAFNTVAALSNINISCTANAALGDDQKTNFAPRVGFAYKLRPTLVVRGGFGTAYGALGNLGYGGTLGLNYPFGYTQAIPAPDSQHPLLAGASNAPATLENTFNNFNFSNPAVLQSPTPYTTTPVSCSTLPLSTCDGGQYIGSDYLGATLNGRQFNYQTPLIQTENLTVEDQFSSHDALQVGYVGTQGRHLDILGNSNSNSLMLPPGTNTQLYIPYPYMARNGTYETTNANTSYNSMQITYQHQMSYGLLVLANYTWSKCMGDQHAPQNSEFNTSYRAQWLAGFGIKGDYGLCDADATDLWHAAATYELPFGRGKQFGSTHEQGCGPHRGRVGAQWLLHLPERPAIHGHLPQRHNGRLQLRRQSDRAEHLCRPAQRYAVAQSQRLRSAGRGHPSWAGRLLAARWRDPTGTRTALQQPGFVNPEELQLHRVDDPAVPRGSLQHHQHAALRAAATAELPGRELQQHRSDEEQQREQRRAHSAACT